MNNLKYGISLVKPSDVDDKTLHKVIAELKRKTEMFMYITEQQFTERFLQGHYVLWLNHKVLAFGEPMKYPSGLIEMEVTVAKYNTEAEYTPAEMRMNLGYAEAFAKEHNVNQIKLNARKGWIKILPDYKVESTPLTKVLD